MMILQNSTAVQVTLTEDKGWYLRGANLMRLQDGTWILLGDIDKGITARILTGVIDTAYLEKEYQKQLI